MTRQQVLTDRHLELVGLLAQGLTYKQIAAQTGISTSTVRSHLHSIYGALGVVDRAQAVLECARRGLIDAPGLGAEDGGSFRQLTDLIAELVGLVSDKRRDLLTSRQHGYLDALERALRTGDSLDLEMERDAFARMCEEARVPAGARIPSLAALAKVAA